MTAQPSGFLYPQDLPDAIQRLKTATAGDQRAAIALDVLLLELESRNRRRLDSSSLGDPDIKHVDGVAWHDAPIPPERHDCFVQTSGWIGLTQYVRCACGAVCNHVEKGYPAATWHWMERNQRRQHGET